MTGAMGWMHGTTLTIGRSRTRAQVMAFTVKGVVENIDSFTGKKIEGTMQVNISVDDLKQIIVDAMEVAAARSKSIKLSRCGSPSPARDHPGYAPIVHQTDSSKPFTVKVDGLVKFSVDDVIEILKYRKRVSQNCKMREKVIKSVRWWRVGKPPNVIRDEVIRDEARKVAEAKRLGLPLPKTIFGTDEEFEYLKSVENDKRQQLKVTLEENPSGEVNLIWPEELETWYNQMLDYELKRFEQRIHAMEYSVTMGLNVGKDGRFVRKKFARGCCAALW